MELHRIIVGIDFSEESEAARLQALNIALTTGAEVMLAHLVPRPPAWAESVALSIDPPYDHAKWMREELDAANERLAAMHTAPAHEGVQVTHHVEEGNPDTLLPALAVDTGADLIVVGTHGRTGYRRLTLGSVAERVVRRAKCAVLVARPGASSGAGYTHIVVPTDFSDTADAALAMATKLIAPQGKIDALHCWRGDFAAHGYYTAYQPAQAYFKQLEERAVERGAELMERYTPRHDAIAFRSINAAPARGILEHMATERYDLVVMGSHGRQGLRRWVVGSIAENTVRHAPCSVLVVH